MSFQQGLSGLFAASRNLEVVGNNVANANTVGAKSSRALFADAYARSLGGTGGFNGMGVQVAGVTQEFSQGAIESSSNSLDVAINGGGFFVLRQGQDQVFSRNGQFHMDKDGYVVNAAGAQLMGFGITSAGQSASVSPVQMNLNGMDGRATDSVAIKLNLDSRTDATTYTAAFNPADPQPAQYSGSTSMTVFDSLGEEHTMSFYFRKQVPVAPANIPTWDVYYGVDGNVSSTPAASGFQFDPSGRPLSTAAITLPDYPGAGTPLPNGANPLAISLDLSGLTQFGQAFSVNQLSQDGYQSGSLTSFSVGNDGTISGRYSNGQSQPLSKIALASFVNPEGLEPVGDNAYRANPSISGSPSIGDPGTGVLGSVKGGAVETSNIDLTRELVNMITAQRMYQANAQTVRTQDQVMQTLVNLK